MAAAPYLAGNPPPGRPRPIQNHQKVRLDLLSISPTFSVPLATLLAGNRRAKPPLLCFSPSRDLKLKETNIPGSNLQNVHGLQNSELVKYITIHRNIVKMQAQLFWNPWNKIYNFCYTHIFSSCSILKYIKD